MEPTARLRQKLSVFEQALTTFGRALAIDLAAYDDIALDTLQSGQIQKFEYCVELGWKTAKLFLETAHGLQTASPQTVFKGLFQIKLIDAATYEALMAMIHHRNRLSHVYNRATFDEIYRDLYKYLAVMQQLLAAMRQELQA